MKGRFRGEGKDLPSLKAELEADPDIVEPTQVSATGIKRSRKRLTEVFPEGEVLSVQKDCRAKGVAIEARAQTQRGCSGWWFWTRGA